MTDGYFDESDHNYVPGVISYEYNKTVPEVKMGQDVDWEALQKGLPEGAEKDITVRKIQQRIMTQPLISVNSGKI